MDIMGSPTLADFTHEASLMIAKAIVAAADDGGIHRSSWRDCWIADTSLEWKPPQ
jgi:hypothetical protein